MIKLVLEIIVILFNVGSVQCVFSFFYFLYRISSLHRMSSFIVKVMCLATCLACSLVKLLVRYMRIVV